MATKNKTSIKKSSHARNSTDSLIVRYKKIVFISIFAILGSFFLDRAFASIVFTDNFTNYSDGLIISEYSFWNPDASDAKKNSNWEMTSGAIFASTIDGSKVGYSGYPTYETRSIANPTQASSNNSAVFRLTSVPKTFKNAEVSFRLQNKQLVSTSGTPAVAWDGIHVFLRYQSEDSLYYASVNRRDGSLAVKKKVPGGSSNGGTYYTLAGTSTNKYPIPFGQWQDIKANIHTNPDNTVLIKIVINGNTLLSVTDNGSVGGAPITNPGKVGIRGDNTEFYFDDFTVNDPDLTTTTPPSSSLGDTIPPTVALTAPMGGSELSGAINTSVQASDDIGVAKVEYYAGSLLIGASNTAPFNHSWDTTKLSNGPYVIKAIAYDAAQNRAVSSDVNVSINNINSTPSQDMTPPVIQVSSPVNDMIYTKSISVKAAATDNVKVMKMQVYIDDTLVFTTNSGSVNTTQRIKTPGSHTVTIVSQDEAGNISRSNINVIKK